MRGRKPDATRGDAALGLSDAQIGVILRRIGANLQVRRSLPGWGRVHIDRQLPFICVYRRPVSRPDAGTPRLLVAEAAYVLAPGHRTFYPSLTRLLEGLARTLVARFGAFLICEIWAHPPSPDGDELNGAKPAFWIYRDRPEHLPETVAALREGLVAARFGSQKPEVFMGPPGRVAPVGQRPLLSRQALRQWGGHWLGLEVSPVYRDAKSGEPYPLLLRSFKRHLGRTLDQAFYAFAVRRTTHHAPHYFALGRRAMVKAVWTIDARLAEVSNAFDFLLQVTPLNVESAWHAFRAKRAQCEPVFEYRPLPIDPGVLKRMLFSVHLERIEDPTLMHLFLEKQTELDRQLTMLHDLGRKAFLYGSLQLHGPVALDLRRTAQQLLTGLPARERSGRSRRVDARLFLARAQAEMAWYSSQFPAFAAEAELREDLYSGLLVSRGRLLIGKQFQAPMNRVDALLQHEVGTHLLTYCNGRAQPFRMLYTGLPGYDALQEGLAVLAEYLVGGLDISRLRVLAARVLAADDMIRGASFLDVFRKLTRAHGFPQRAAFTVAMRVFRGGGLAKDAVYLRGLLEVLDYLRHGGQLEPLMVGKIALTHVEVVEELLQRQILKPPPLRPRYLDHPDAALRLRRIRSGMSMIQLIRTEKGKT